ncbi:MAG: hypothetical protein KJN90_01910 [Gammaproteobacteria bacterium]|nr:hypothetical protein [Gammaproteobacteria bacterium]
MKKVLLGALLTGLLLVGNNAQALVSYCGYGPGHDGFYHRASLGLLEISYPFVTTWMETHVNGPLSPSLYSAFYNTLNSWHFFLDMPPGDYSWQGYAQSETAAVDYFWGILDFSACAGARRVEAPPYCETEEIQVTGSTTLTSSIHSYLVSAIKNGFEAVEKLGVCSMTGSPSFSGSLKLENVSQCCEATDSNDSTTRAAGRATFSVPSLSCSVKQIIVPAYGIVLEGSIGAGAAATLGYSGMDKGMCGAASSEITISGTISGGFGGEIGVGGISTRIVGAGVRLSDSFSIGARGPDVYNLTLNGCIGPAVITGWVRFLGSEVKTEIVPREWAEGTTLCL